MKWFAQAPANIALIKYMGKQDEQDNTPANASLSYTLHDLLSFCEVENIPGNEDFWEALEMPGGLHFDLDEKAQQRYLNHLQRVREHFDYTGAFTVRSCNNFPTANGLASSASSFAALTKAATRAICERMQTEEPSASEQAKLSQQGSGSSCRSFFSPWALWDATGVDGIDLPYTDLIHHTVILETNPKAVSSSEAHRRVVTSPHFTGRSGRATTRLENLLDAFKQEDWKTAHKIVREEFLDMHELFTTSEKSFQYITPETQQVLDDLDRYWDVYDDGPLVTLDAGPNVHLLFRADQAELAEEMKETFLNDHDVI